MRRAIFGGSFNPIHNDHIKLALQFAEEFDLDKVTLIPTYTTPLKDNSEIADGRHRLRMCQLATEGYPQLEVSDIELKRGGMSYTSDTVTALKNDTDELFLIVGADMYVTLDQWHEFRTIFANATILAASRNELGYISLKEKYKEYQPYGCRTLISHNLVGPLSSTAVRAAVKAGGDISGMVDQRVADYIKKHGLYR